MRNIYPNLIINMRSRNEKKKNMVAHTLYNISLFLSIPSNSELQNSLLKFDLTTYSAIYTIAEMC